jgi:hypothetical protein
MVVPALHDREVRPARRAGVRTAAHLAQLGVPDAHDRAAPVFWLRSGARSSWSATSSAADHDVGREEADRGQAVGGGAGVGDLVDGAGDQVELAVLAVQEADPIFGTIADTIAKQLRDCLFMWLLGLGSASLPARGSSSKLFNVERLVFVDGGLDGDSAALEGFED